MFSKDTEIDNHYYKVNIIHYWCKLTWFLSFNTNNKLNMIIQFQIVGKGGVSQKRERVKGKDKDKEWNK